MSSFDYYFSNENATITAKEMLACIHEIDHHATLVAVGKIITISSFNNALLLDLSCNDGAIKFINLRGQGNIEESKLLELINILRGIGYDVFDDMGKV
jgi:hypothetical protein